MKHFVVAAALLLAVAPAFAQTAPPAAPAKQAPAKAPMVKRQLPPPEERAISYSKELKNKLTLTDDQYQKVLAVNTECIRRKDALRASGKTDSQGFKEISAYRKQQFQTILTPEQQKKLTDLDRKSVV